MNNAIEGPNWTRGLKSRCLPVVTRGTVAHTQGGMTVVNIVAVCELGYHYAVKNIATIS